jgi:uncharacterized membrane protein YdjX (TVP38/TMEM64 family)
MHLVTRVLVVAILLAGIFVALFAILGERFDALIDPSHAIPWFESIRPYAWLVAIGLLVSDLVLPVPATGVMAVLGAVYGTVPGAAIGATGFMLAGLTGYGLARVAGRRGARWLASDEEMDRFRSFFDRWGGYAVILSRLAPVLPEVTTVLAGLARMHFGRFLAALALGSVPMALLFAWIGQASPDHPAFGIAVAVVIPLSVWPLVATRFRTPRKQGGPDPGPA